MRFKALTTAGVVLGGVFVSLPAFATTYTRDVEVKFNFNSSMSVVVDTADIEILDLAPGTSADSNIVGISISTNNIVGYTASATVGSVDNATTNMTHTNGTNTFASIATDADLSSLTTDNTWGYSTSTDNGTSWSNFSGLPLYTDTAKQIATTSGPSNDAIKFKINAKASTAQPAGDYTNKINFIVVANVPPRDFPDVISPDNPKDPETNRPTIQSINEDICNQVEAYDTQFLVTDIRDHKNYWISKLRDGYCWMTQNLDLDLDSTKTYTSTNTDLGWNGLGYTSTSWQPSLSTIPSTNFDSTTKYIYGWQASSSDPYSVDVGDLYWDSNTNTIGETPDPVNGTHSHVGNNYNFIAATANNSSIDSPYSNQPNSICPTNWGLPPIGQERSMNDLYQYYGNTTATGEYYLSAPLYFVISGHVSARYDNTMNQIVGYYASPWSSTWYWYNAKAAMELYETAVSFSTPDVYMGHNIRCRTRAKDKFTVNFDANNGDGNMSAQKISYGKSAALTTNTFTRSGYSFNGWNTKADGTGVGYGNRDSYSAPATNTTSSVTLYAQWVEDSGQGGGGGGYSGKTLQDAYEQAYVRNEDQSGHYYDTNAGRYKKGLYVPHKTNGVYDGTYFEATQASDYEGIPANDLRFAIQDIDMEINGVKVCDYATVIGSEAYVLDLRDFSSYHIVKAKDGRCWLADNLSLDLLNPDVLSSLSPSNTNADSASLTSLRSGNRASGNQYATSGITSSTSGGYYSIPQIYRLIKNNSNSTDAIQELRTSKYGILYNYCAATAGSYCYGNENTYGTSYNNPNSAIDAEYDICPSGWRMPTGGYIGTSGSTAGGGEYQQLHDAYNDDTDSTRLVARLPLSGYYDFYYASTYSQNSTGYYWSSTRYENENRIFEMAVNANSVYPISTSQYLDGRYLGYSVRCIAK